MNQKQGHSVPYELNPREAYRRYFTCEKLLQRQKNGFLHRIVTDDEKWSVSMIPQPCLIIDGCAEYSQPEYCVFGGSIYGRHPKMNRFFKLVSVNYQKDGKKLWLALDNTLNINIINISLKINLYINNKNGSF